MHQIHPTKPSERYCSKRLPLSQQCCQALWPKNGASVLIPAAKAQSASVLTTNTKFGKMAVMSAIVSPHPKQRNCAKTSTTQSNSSASLASWPESPSSTPALCGPPKRVLPRAMTTQKKTQSRGGEGTLRANRSLHRQSQREAEIRRDRIKPGVDRDRLAPGADARRKCHHRRPLQRPPTAA